MKKITKKTCENGIKCILFIAVGCFVLFMFHILEAFVVDRQTWYLIALITAAAAVQWAALAVFLHYRSDEIGETYKMEPLHWFLAFLPSIVLGVLFIILYSALHSSVSFFAIRGGNFGLALVILLIGTGLCYLFDYAYIAATKKNQVQQTTVKSSKKRRAPRPKSLPSLPKRRKNSPKNSIQKRRCFPISWRWIKNFCSLRTRPHPPQRSRCASCATASTPTSKVTKCTTRPKPSAPSSAAWRARTS